MSIVEALQDFIPRPVEVRRKRLMPIAEARSNHPILGVAVFIVQNGKIFTVEENQTKKSTGKQKGEQGILCETLEPGETFEQGVVRCFREELGVPTDRIGGLFSVDPSACCLGEGESSGVFGRGYQVELTGSEAELQRYIAHGDGEITPVGFLTLQELRARRLRAATKVALELHVPVRDAKNQSLLPLSVENLTAAG